MVSVATDPYEEEKVNSPDDRIKVKRKRGSTVTPLTKVLVSNDATVKKFKKKEIMFNNLFPDTMKKISAIRKFV